MMAPSKHCLDYHNHVALLVTSEKSNNASDTQAMCVHADICSRGHAASLWYSHPIMIIFSWFFMSHFKSNDLWATWRGEDLREKVPRLTEWSEMSRAHSQTLGGCRGRTKWSTICWNFVIKDRDRTARIHDYILKCQLCHVRKLQQDIDALQ